MLERNLQEAQTAPSSSKIALIPKALIFPFILITFCFALWGFANDITNPLVKAFGIIFNQSAFISSFVQFAFYGGYCFMAIPAAIFIKKYSYKSGILVGLALYAFGGILFIPAST
ncbi:MAG: MFS transporter, partial [Bacteroidota bacterium]